MFNGHSQNRQLVFPWFKENIPLSLTDLKNWYKHYVPPKLQISENMGVNTKMAKGKKEAIFRSTETLFYSTLFLEIVVIKYLIRNHHYS